MKAALSGAAFAFAAIFKPLGQGARRSLSPRRHSIYRYQAKKLCNDGIESVASGTRSRYSTTRRAVVAGQVARRRSI